MPRYQQQQQQQGRTGGQAKGGGAMGAISVVIFKFQLWLCDPFADCRKAREARRAENDEECDITRVKYMFRANNLETMWTPRMDLPPPRLNDDFLCSLSKTSSTPSTTSASTSPPASDCSDNTDSGDSDDFNSDGMEQPPSDGSSPVVRASAGGVPPSTSIFASMSTPRPPSRSPSTSSFSEDDILGGKLWWF